MGDSTLLRAVFVNLIGNAVKFTRDRDPAHIQVSARAGEEGHAVVQVADDGAGFDLARAEKLFGAFQRFHTATEFEGTGIGLATVQRIVHRHGGRVWAEAAPGAGATFFLSLPEAAP
jgi:signal transduction histidine kinase